MPGFRSQIRAVSTLKVKRPYLSVIGANSLTETKEDRVWRSITLAGWQTNQWDPHLAASTLNSLINTNYTTVFKGITLAGWQHNDWGFQFNAYSNSFLFAKAEGIVESIARVITTVSDLKLASSTQAKASSNIQYQRSDLEDIEAYFDFDESTRTVDSVLVFSWRGSITSNNDFIFVEYKNQSDGPWRDISDSLNYIVAHSSQEYVTPSFFWDDIPAIDENEEISYDLIIAYDHQLKNVVREISDITESSHTLEYANRLATGLTYYWAVRAKDTYGGVSDWSIVKSFHAYQHDPTFITNVNGTKRLLIPYSDYEYAWYTGNLPNGLYGYSIYKYNSVTGTSVPIVPPTGGGRLFIVDHNTTNPPEIVNAEYDDQQYLLKFDVKIYDSLHRKYNVKRVQYADQRDKIIGEEPLNFDVQAHNWKDIPLSELRGRRKNLESNPFINAQSTMTWSFSGRRESGKIYTYNLQISSEQIAYMKNFKWAYRAYYQNDSPGPWVEQDFDYNDESFWNKESYNIGGTLESFLDMPRYFGKAKRNGIVMNKTRFPLAAETGMQEKFDFRLYYDDVENPILERSSIESDHLTLLPTDFYGEITNVIVDLEGIEQEYYELYPAEIQKILNQHSNLDFFWQVQVNDGIDTSGWSRAKRSDEFNVHHFEWYTLIDAEFNSSDFYVLRVELELAEEYRKYEFPKFEWMAKVNTEIEQYYAQIERLEQDFDKYSPALQSQNQAYINYLKTRVFAIRLRVYEHILAQGLLEDPVVYYNQNVHDLPVLDSNGARTSDLDFGFNGRISEKDIKGGVSLTTGEQEWSSVMSKFRLDRTREFDSQEGKPLREYKATGRACKNEAFTQCFLSTGDPYSCPWVGKLCPGFSVSRDRLTDSFSVEDPDGTLQTYPTIEPEDWEEFFSPGDCPMQDGGPCYKFDVTEHNMQEHTCEVCGEPRYLQFITVGNDGGYSLLEDYYSQINPIGFANVNIVSRSGENLSSSRWNPVASKGQTRQPKPSFLGFEMIKSQLPGELNSDVLDTKNQRPLSNSYFNESLLAEDSGTDLGVDLTGGWHPNPSGADAKFHVIEIF